MDRARSGQVGRLECRERPECLKHDGPVVRAVAAGRAVRGCLPVRPSHVPAAGRARGRLHRLLAIALAAAGLACGVSAARAGEGAVVVDPPARVGRVALILGRLDYYSESQADWVDASVNLPITSRSALASTSASRAEVRIGTNAVRLDSATQANFTQLDDAGVQVELVRGAVQVTLHALPRGDRVALIAATVRLQVSRSGRYRLDFDPSTHLAMARVLEGAAELVMAGQRVPVQPLQQVTVDTQSGAITAQGAAAQTAFDDWAAARDRAPEPVALRRRYVPASMTGAEALDDYGTWQADSVYGPVWYPASVGAGWAPYRTGRWAWVAPWGWTWIDDAPWGFAPFHYGRWAFVGGRWGWVPGTYVARPVYAPALVGFFGGEGARWSPAAGIGGAVVGWFPLAPAEVWVPAYPASVTYVRNVNVTHVTNVTTISNAISNTPALDNTIVTADGSKVVASGREYRYAQTSFAATAVPQAAFAAGHAVAPAQVPLTPAQLAMAPPPSTRLLPAAPAGAGSVQATRAQQRFMPPPHAGLQAIDKVAAAGALAGTAALALQQDVRQERALRDPRAQEAQRTVRRATDRRD